MDDDLIEKLLEALTTVMESTGETWKDKRDAILALASEQDKTNLIEFGSWYWDPE